MLTPFLIKKFIKNHHKESCPVVRKNYHLLEGWLSIIVNILLASYKIIAGILSGSLAILMDGVHTLSDVLSSFVVIFSALFSHKKPDTEHPFGHGRAEIIGSLFVAILLSFVGFEFFKSSLDRILNPQPITTNAFVWGAIFSSIMIKEWMARFSFSLGKKIDSDILLADGIHHRSDAFSSLVVLLGLGSQFFFQEKVAGTLGWFLNRIDGFLGIVLAGFIFYTAFEMMKKNVNQLIGEAPNSKDLKNIRQIALQIQGVKGVHNIIVHQYGAQKIVSLHAEVPNHFSLIHSHDLAEAIEDLIEEQLGFFATVHIDPLELDNPLIHEFYTFIIKTLKQLSFPFDNVHDVRIVYKDYKKHLSFDISIANALKEGEENKIKEKLTKALQDHFDNLDKITIQIDPIFNY